MTAPVINHPHYNQCLETIGVGWFHRYLLILCGAANAADAVEIVAISFALPLLENDLNLSGSQEGALTAIIFLGMMIGSWFWGYLADRFGRRLCLISSLLLNGIFGTLLLLSRRMGAASLVFNTYTSSGAISAASSSFFWLLLFRFGSGFGVGGSIPVVFTYFSEFLPISAKNNYIVYLSMFWMCGSIFAAGSAWIVIPNAGWRLYLAISAIPSLLTGTLLFSQPESPAYLLTRGHVDEAAIVLGSISIRNSFMFRTVPRYSFADETSDVLPRPGVMNLDEIRRELARDVGGAAEVTERSQTDALPIDRDAEALLSHDSNTQAPERSRSSSEDPDVKNTSPASLNGSPLDSNNSHRRSMSEIDIAPSQSFTDPHNNPNDVCILNGLCARCWAWWKTASLATVHLYTSIETKHSARILSIVWYTLAFGFYGMTLWLPKYFSDLPNEQSVYLTAFLTSVSNLPGSIGALFIMRGVGPVKTLALSMGISALVVFSFLLAQTSTQVTIIACIFGAVSVGGWNCLNILSAEQFPYEVRSSAYGVFAACGRIGAISGNLIFGAFESTHPSIPLVLVSSCLLLGGILNLLLPTAVHR